MRCHSEVIRQFPHPEDPTVKYPYIDQCSNEAKFVITDGLGRKFLACGVHARRYKDKRPITPEDKILDIPNHCGR